MSHLISRRAKQRSRLHFSIVDPATAPEGFTPHPDPLSLDAGMPNVGFFPIESIHVNVVDHPFQTAVAQAREESPESIATLLEDESALSNTKGAVIITQKTDDPNLIDLSRGLQYSEVEGIPHLLKFTRELVERAHPPLYGEWNTVLSNGAGDGLNKAADAFLDEGDVVLIEEFTFVPFLQNVSNAGAIPVPVKLSFDTEAGKNSGLDIDYLSNLLENWEELKPGLRKPKALYTIASGQNPTGFTQSLEFRKQVYALAEKYDFAIIEDDPYGYLTLPPYSKPEGVDKLAKLTIEDYLGDHLVPSYLTVDTSGRVLRIETFSKLFAPGLRLGFIVGHKDVVAAIANYANVVTRSSSGTSQLLVNNVIQQKYGGVDGWLQWILKMRATYTNRRNVLLNHLYELEAYKAGYFKAIDPRAGMFVSVVINFPPDTDIEEKVMLLFWKFRAYGVRVVPGINMAIDRKFSVERGNFFRLTYALANSDAELAEGADRFARAVYDFFQKGLAF